MTLRTCYPNAECGVWNAELICRLRARTSASRIETGITIPHSTFRTPHWGRERGRDEGRPHRRHQRAGRDGGGRERRGAVPRRRGNGSARGGRGDRPVPAEGPPPHDPGREQGGPAPGGHAALGLL